MDYTINTSKNWQITVEVRVSAEELKAHYDRAVQNVQKTAVLQGFRKGKVPVNLVKQLFASQIEKETVEIGMEEAWRRVFEKNRFDIYNDPSIRNRKQLENGDLTFDIVFDLYPEVQVPDLDGMEVEKIVWEVTPEAVEKVIQNLRSRHAMFFSKEEPAKVGDHIVGDFQETDDSGVPLLGNRFEDQEIHLHEKDSELTPQLLGVKAGDQRQVMLKVRTQSDLVEQPYSEPETVKFYRVTVKEVKELRLPELDDHFVKELGGSAQTPEELRQMIEADLRRRAEQETQRGFEDALASEVVKRSDLELPPSMIEAYLDRMVESARRRSRDEEFDEEGFRNYLRPRAVFELKWHLLSEEIKNQQGFAASDEEIEAKLEPLRAHPESEDFIKRIRSDERELKRLKEQITDEKLFAFLASKAKVRETVRAYGDLLASSPEEAA